MRQINRNNENGFADGWMIATIALIFLTIAAGALAGWSYINYNDQKNNVDLKIDTAVALAKKAQADADEIKFTEREKQPNREFVGPDDYGRVTFDYPKTWSVFIDKDSTSGGNYEAYINPVVVPPVTSSQQFAVRLVIKQEDYDKAVSKFDSLVKKGELKSVPVTVDNSTGVRFDGNFSKDLRGSLVIFKVRDKTVTIRTDADTFKADFDALVNTVKFNQ